MGSTQCKCCLKLCTCCINNASNDGYQPIKSITSNRASSIDICKDIWRWIKSELSSEQLMWKICTILGRTSTNKLSSTLKNSNNSMINTGFAISVGILLGKLNGFFQDAIYQQYFPQNRSEQQSLIQRAMKLLNYKRSDIKSMNISDDNKLKQKCKQKLISSKQFDSNDHSIYGDECESATDISTDSDSAEIIKNQMNNNNGTIDMDQEFEMEFGILIEEYQKYIINILDDTKGILAAKEEKLFRELKDTKALDYTESKYIYRY